jgi:hypothetical protein
VAFAIPLLAEISIISLSERHLLPGEVFMGVSRLFWPQELLDQWIIDEKISLDGERLTIREGNSTYRVRQAVYFTADVGDGSDAHKLLGRVKELKQLEEMGAEKYMDSVLVEDSAYQVVTGFVGEQFPIAEGEQDERKDDQEDAAQHQSGESSEESDKELLAKFLIDNL